jgi:hypothetical protein
MVFEGSGLTRWGILNILPYWGELKIRHLLDLMHIEGNVGKAIIKQLYGEKDSNFLHKPFRFFVWPFAKGHNM